MNAETALEDADMALGDAERLPTGREHVLALARAYGTSSLAWRAMAEQGESLASAVADADLNQAMELWRQAGLIR